MGKSKTDVLYDIKQENRRSFSPRLFVCCGKDILEFSLSGEQRLGRADSGEKADIPIPNRFVSAGHGRFYTTDDKVYYFAESTTNGILYQERFLEKDERINLSDGDELLIPTGEEDSDVLLVAAFSENRIKIWRELREGTRDYLTGLPGRAGINAWFEQKRKNILKKACVFILDIDHFKELNDKYGHDAGDAALKFLASELSETVGEEGYLSRWGGDEFTGILRGSKKEAEERLLDFADRMRNSKVEGKFGFSVSIGLLDIRDAPSESIELENLVKLADVALYRAKSEGRDRLRIVEFR